MAGLEMQSGSGLTIDQLPPLEASVTGIHRSLSSTANLGTTSEVSHESCNSEQRPDSSSNSYKTKTIPRLHRYWHAVQDAVSPEIALESSETPPAISEPTTPDVTALPSISEPPVVRRRRSNTTPPAIRASSSASSVKASASASSPRTPDLTSKGYFPSTAPVQEEEAKPSFLVIDQDFNKLLSGTQQFDGLGSHEVTPRNSTSRSRPPSPHFVTPSERQIKSQQLKPSISQASSNHITYPPLPSSRSSISPQFEQDLNSCDGTFELTPHQQAWYMRAKAFLSPSFDLPAVEKAFQKESWNARKSAAVTSSFVIFLLWITFAVSRPGGADIVDKILFFGIDSSFSVTLIILIVFDMHIKCVWAYQAVCFVNCWALPFTVLIQSWRCDFFHRINHSRNTCEGRDFVHVFLWPLGFPVLHLFLLSAWRGHTLLGYIAWLASAVASVANPGNKTFGCRSLFSSSFVPQLTSTSSVPHQCDALRTRNLMDLSFARTKRKISVSPSRESAQAG